MTPPDRADPPDVGDERSILDGFLEFHRQTLVLKCAGLTDDQLRERSVPPSAMSLLGLVRHLAQVERGWFQEAVAGEEPGDLFDFAADPDADWHGAATASVEESWAQWRRECDRSRAIAASLPLDHTFVDGTSPERSLRWVLVHMIEEYCRHNGHADLLRERLDGATGE